MLHISASFRIGIRFFRVGFIPSFYFLLLVTESTELRGACRTTEETNRVPHIIAGRLHG
jgi:hypothetical protein